MNNQINDNQTWAENIIIIDADYADSVAFDLIVNFERMLERRIPQADIALWLDCLALDGGIREGENEVQVILIHEKSTKSLKNFVPSSIEKELDKKAFKDHLGEFIINEIPTESVAPKEQLFCDVIQTMSNLSEVKRIIAVPDMAYYDSVRTALRNVDEEKRITLLAMQPMSGGNFRQEILGYSLMQALGIHADELK
jgi:hypothetical protein